MTESIAHTDPPMVRFAVVGCGNIGSRHLAVINSLPGAAVVGFCDTDSAKLHKYSEEYGDIPAFKSIEEMLAGCDADVINICTPHYLHSAHTLAAIEAGRNVLVEKPMCLSTRDADAMIAAAKQNSVLLMVVKQNRHNVPVTLLREAMDKNRLGKILMAQCNVIWNRFPGYYSRSPWLGRRALEGGALYTQVSHFIDLLVWMCGDVVAAGGAIETKVHGIETEDCGAAWLRFSEGAIGTLLWTTAAYDKNAEGSITLIGERGTVKIAGQYLNKVEYWNVEGFPLPSEIEWIDRPNSYGRYQGSSSNHDKVFAEVIHRVNREDHQTVSGEEARRTIRGIELIYDNCDRRTDRKIAE